MLKVEPGWLLCCWYCGECLLLCQPSPTFAHKEAAKSVTLAHLAASLGYSIACTSCCCHQLQPRVPACTLTYTMWRLHTTANHVTAPYNCRRRAS
ncbi:hypothetical protein COO60DRAFT_99160 [Scenedesmus sp. NREL 46B-D3]|nr:hypothetical protein COO60DRAFT_99160 [Scenedesmus sp. NREL 46B-D3]